MFKVIRICCFQHSDVHYSNYHILRYS
jgi:hypothetical protein